jgi:hypothetical protein
MEALLHFSEAFAAAVPNSTARHALGLAPFVAVLACAVAWSVYSRGWRAAFAAFLR